MNDPRIPALLVSHHRPGFYFRVLEEGDVEAGDEIVKLASGPEADDGRRGRRAALPPRAPAPATAPGAADPGAQPRLAGLVPRPARGRPGQRQRRPRGGEPASRLAGLPSADRHRDHARERLGDLDPPRGPGGRAAPAPRAPASTSRCASSPTTDQRSLLRNYSLSGPPDAGYYRIAVKRERDGAASGYLHTRLAVGDQLDVAAPRGTFILDRTHAPVLLISAGIGATPVLAMLQALAEEHSDREIWWLHGARSSRDHAFAAEARALLAALPNARAHVYYSRPGPDDLEGRDFDSAGRLTASVLAELEPPRDAEAYLCGPTPFMDEISAGLAAMGIDASRIHTEPFGPAPGLTPGIAATPARAPHPPAGQPGTGPTIEFARSNLAIPWSSDYASLLELAEACDVPVRWSCRTGVCHNCETTLIAGELDYSPDPVEPPADGKRAHLLLAAARRRGARSVTLAVQAMRMPLGSPGDAGTSLS